MMINKRLISVCDESKKYMGLTIVCSWIGLVCNIIIIWLIGQLLNTMVAGQTLDLMSGSLWGAMSNYKLTTTLSLSTGIIITVIALIIKLVSHHLYGLYSYKSSANARTTLRRLVYEKLLRLGMDYQNAEKTSGVVQLSIEGVEQLEIYFGKYIPQFFYSLLAPLTLFVVISFISWKAALVFMLCVPLCEFRRYVFRKLTRANNLKSIRAR